MSASSRYAGTGGDYERFLAVLKGGKNVGPHPFRWFGDNDDVAIPFNSTNCGYDGDAVLYVTLAEEGGDYLAAVNVYANNDRDRTSPKDVFLAKCLAVGLFGGSEQNKGHVSGIGNFASGAGLGECPVPPEKVGTGLMNLAEKLFTCFGQKKVVLQDSSNLLCHDRDTSAKMPLALFRTLTSGRTFYQRFDFVYQDGNAQKMEIQKDLYDLPYAELRKAYETCGMRTALVDGTLSEFEKNHAAGYDKPLRAGSFFKWLWTHDCEHAAEILSETLLINCKAFSSTKLQSYVSSVNELSGYLSGVMVKTYS